MTEFPFPESLDDVELDVAAIAELLECSLERAHRLLDSTIQCRVVRGERVASIGALREHVLRQDALATTLDELDDHLDDIPRHLPLTAHHVWDPWEGRYFELQHRIVTIIQALPRGS